MQNISRQKANEEKHARSNNILRALNRWNKALSKDMDNAELFAEKCRIIVEEGGYLGCWIGLRLDDADRASMEKWFKVVHSLSKAPAA